MEKLFTITVTVGEESNKLERLLKDLGVNVLDYDKSKAFKVKREIVYELMVYSIVSTEEVFSIITKAINGIRLY